MKKWVNSMFSARPGSVSSKRVIGVVSWLVVLFVLVYCTITDKEAPDVCGAVILASTSLLGVDSITKIFSKNENTDR